MLQRRRRLNGGAEDAGHGLIGLKNIMTREPHALLLTGVPGIGKTTIMRKVAAALLERQIRGFITDEIRRAGQRVGFELCSLGGRTTVLAHIDIPSRYRVGRYHVDVGALDAAIEETLVLDAATDLYLVDEIGKMECLSEKFRSAIHALLDSKHILLATVALRGTGFIAAIKERQDVEVWHVTRENRNDLPEQIVRWIDRARGHLTRRT